MLQSSGSGDGYVEIIDEGLLASLLLVLQQLPSLLTSAPRSETVSKVREGLSQVYDGVWSISTFVSSLVVFSRQCSNSKPFLRSVQSVP